MIEDLVNQGKICKTNKQKKKQKKKTPGLKTSAPLHSFIFYDDVTVLIEFFENYRGQIFDSSYTTLKATLASKKTGKVSQSSSFKSANKQGTNY